MRRVFVSVAMGTGFVASSSSSTVIVSLMFFEVMASSSLFSSLSCCFLSASVVSAVVAGVCEALSERGAGEEEREGVSDKALRAGEVCADEVADACLSLPSSSDCDSVRPEDGVVTAEGDAEEGADEECVDADEEDENDASTAGDDAEEREERAFE